MFIISKEAEMALNIKTGEFTEVRITTLDGRTKYDIAKAFNISEEFVKRVD